MLDGMAGHAAALRSQSLHIVVRGRTGRRCGHAQTGQQGDLV
jgi:hypothetical protein